MSSGLIMRKHLMEAIEAIDWYSVNEKGGFHEGAPDEASAYVKYSNVVAAVLAVAEADDAPEDLSQWEHMGGDEWCCAKCGHVITTEGSWENPMKKFCEECGVKMKLPEEPV